MVTQPPAELVQQLQDYFISKVGLGSKLQWPTFENRLTQHYAAAARAFYNVYGFGEQTQLQFKSILQTVLSAWIQRADDLHKLDEKREAQHDWFNSHQMVGASCYIDLFAGSLQNLRERIPYLVELGITYLYVLPFFKSPEGENDGGFAVSSYKEVDPRLGTMEDLDALTRDFREYGISLVVDFVLNHTSNEHEWAIAAADNHPVYRHYYHIFDHDQIDLVEQYKQTASNPFPDQGDAINFNPQMNKWVWSAFYRYQWDLNYSNPAVFEAMLDNALFLVNRGVEVLRLDAVPLIWKKLGTACVSEPESYRIVEAYRALIAMAAPAVGFKSEAIMDPPSVMGFLGKGKCDIAYRPVLASNLFEALATGNAQFLSYCAQKWQILPEGSTWLNYVNHHDDFSWCFSNYDFTTLHFGQDPEELRRRLNRFYTGQDGNSFARGLPFQYEERNGYGRIAGTLASLLGLEKAAIEGNRLGMLMAIRRINLVHGVLLSIGGLPMIFLGQELGVLNNYRYLENEAQKSDSRWVHRLKKDWGFDQKRIEKPSSPGAMILNFFKQAVTIRKTQHVLAGTRLSVLNTGCPSIFAFVRGKGKERILVIANLSHFAEVISSSVFSAIGFNQSVTELLNNQCLSLADDIEIPAYGIGWYKLNGAD